MVFVQFKKTDKNSFMLQFPKNTFISDVLLKIIEYNNIRIYLDRLIWSVEELANKGVLKPAELQAVSFEDYEKNPQQFAYLPENKLAYATKPIVQKPYRYKPDKNNQRFGVILPEQQQNSLLEAVKFGKSVMEPKKELINKKDIIEAIENIRLAVILAYPGYFQLPEWEPTFLILEEKLSLQILETENFETFNEKAKLWWAGKQLEKNKRLIDYVGTNDKTRIVVKAQKEGGEQPLREPPVDAQAYQQMVRFYYKKVEQNKEFEKRSVETHYEKLAGESLKQKVHLGDQIQYKAF